MQQPLFIFHVDRPRPGIMEQWAQKRFGGYNAIFAHIQALPDPATVSSPVVIFGGPMGVRDIPRLAWLSQEAEWIGTLLERNHPVLGICLGAQLMAHALGQTVTSCPRGTIECGYHPVWSDKGLPSHVYHWHRDGVILDPGSGIECLGRSKWLSGQASQAFRRGRMLGVQFHPEVCEQTISAWLLRDQADLSLPGARPGHTHLLDHGRYGQAVSIWLEQQLERAWGLSGALPAAAMV